MFSINYLRVPFWPLPSTIGKIKFPLPTPTETIEAIAKLATVMYYIDVDYGLIGGSAIISYADHFGLPKRLTADIDLIIQPDLETNVGAEEVSRFLCSEKFSEDFALKKISGVDIPQVRVQRGEREILVDVKVLDHYVCPERRADYDMRLRKNELDYVMIDGQTVFLMNAPWMLRQKILTWSERKGEKREIDKMDIETLCDILSEAKTTLKISSEGDIKKLKEFLEGYEHDPRVLGAVIDCPEVFGPWYYLKWVRRTLAGFLFFTVPLVLDYVTSTTDQILDDD